MTNEPAPDEWMSAREAARLLGVKSVKTVYNVAAREVIAERRERWGVARVRRWFWRADVEALAARLERGTE